MYCPTCELDFALSPLGGGQALDCETCELPYHWKRITRQGRREWARCVQPKHMSLWMNRHPADGGTTVGEDAADG